MLPPSFGMAPATQMLRRVYLEKLRERYGKNAITSMRPEFVAQMIDRMTPSSAHNWIKSIRGLMQHAMTCFEWVGSISAMANYSSANPRPAPNF
jgi:hypothetical protein